MHNYLTMRSISRRITIILQVKYLSSNFKFFGNGALYEQLDGVSMGSSLGPVLANIILSEFENVKVTELVNFSVNKNL